MKVLKYLNVFLPVVACLIFFVSCTKEDDYKKEFQKGGEITYAGTLDSVIAQSGKNKINLLMYLGRDASVVKVKAYWNDGADSTQIAVPRPATSPFVNLLIPNLPVGTYNFKIYTYDTQNNRSVVKNVSGITYDDEYENGLVNRRVESIKRHATKDSLLINWVALSPGLVKTDLTYTKANGEVVTIIVSAKEAVTRLDTDYLVGSTLSYKSTFKFNDRAFEIFTVLEPSTLILDELTSYPK